MYALVAIESVALLMLPLNCSCTQVMHCFSSTCALVLRNYDVCMGLLQGGSRNIREY